MLQDNKIENNKLPQHIAIIPDGNRRWAKEKSLEPWKGHEAGAAKLEQFLKVENEVKKVLE